MRRFWLGWVRLKWEVHSKASTMNAFATAPSSSMMFLNVLWLAVGDHLFCAKHAFAEMGDMHIIFGNEDGLQVWYMPGHQIPNREVFASVVTHTHMRGI